MIGIVVAAVLSVSVQDHLEGAEIGDATQFVSFRTGGRYSAERKDASGRTVARGKWQVVGDTLKVQVASCNGKACATLGKPWSAKIEVLAERAMTVVSEPATAPLSSGSYYCRSQGCEKRIGVELVSHAAGAEVLDRMLEFLIDKNRGREVTVVWIGKSKPAPQASTQISWCGREGDRARKGAELVLADLRQLGWAGQTRVVPGPRDCLYDVRVVVGDGVRATASR